MSGDGVVVVAGDFFFLPVCRYGGARKDNTPFINRVRSQDSRSLQPVGKREAGEGGRREFFSGTDSFCYACGRICSRAICQLEASFYYSLSGSKLLKKIFFCTSNVGA